MPQFILQHGTLLICTAIAVAIAAMALLAWAVKYTQRPITDHSR